MVKFSSLLSGLLFVGFCLLILPVAGGDRSSPEGLIAFWRDVFARPIEHDAQDNVSSTSALRVALGRALFRDTRLSGRENRSCASCHLKERGFTNGLARALGLDGRPLKRNTPTLYNLAWGKSFNWDGSAKSLEQQNLGPILKKNELGGAFPQIVSRLSSDAILKAQFASTFPGNPIVSKDNILASLSAFEKTLVAPVTRFDRWISGDDRALSISEKAGFKIFVGKGGCVACHAGWRFTDDGFHDTGLPVPSLDVNGDTAGKIGLLAFKTPTLRALRMSGPYMHDGSIETLMGVVEHYSEGVQERKGLAPLLKRKLGLTIEEKEQLVSFLKTL